MPTTVFPDDRTRQQALERMPAQAARARERMASGRRLNTAADGAADVALSDRLERDARLATQAVRNASDTLSAARVGDQALATVGDTLGRLAELASGAASDTLAPEQRQTVAREFDQLRQAIDRVAGDTEFNGVHLLRRGEAVAASVGDDHPEIVSFSTVDASASALGVATASITTPDAARAAIDAITGALDHVAGARAGLSVAESRLASGIRSRVVAQEQQSAASARIADADVAGEVASAVASDILLESGVALQAQANLEARQVLRLLQH